MRGELAGEEVLAELRTARAARRRPSPARRRRPRSERWMWQELPSRSFGLAMKVSVMPSWAAISLAPFL